MNVDNWEQSYKTDGTPFSRHLQQERELPVKALSLGLAGHASLSDSICVLISCTCEVHVSTVAHSPDLGRLALVECFIITMSKHIKLLL